MTLLLAYWKPVPEWPEYEISNLGEVRRLIGGAGTRAGKKMNPTVGNRGYVQLRLSGKLGRKFYLLHRLVVLTFLGKIPAGLDVCHFDGVKTNNKLSNLRTDTRKGNLADEIRLGKAIRGERCGTNKFSQEVILKARDMMDSGAKAADVAKQFGFSKNYPYSLLDRSRWGWL